MSLLSPVALCSIGFEGERGRVIERANKKTETLWPDLSPPSMHRLMVAALELFAARGYHGTTTRAIASRARMSPAALYMHYRSKNKLLSSIIRNTHVQILEEMRRAASSESDPVDRLSALVRTHVTFHARWFTAALVANGELRSLESKRDLNEILELRREGEQLFESAIAEGVRSGDFEVKDIHTTTFAILSVGIGVARWYGPEGKLSPEEMGQMHAELIVKMLFPRRRGEAQRRSRTSKKIAPGSRNH